jgi:hypothetical protein
MLATAGGDNHEVRLWDVRNPREPLDEIRSPGSSLWGVALSRDTRALVRLEKQSGPVETVRYEDAFKDPYLLDFLGIKGAYSEKDLEAAIKVVSLEYRGHPLIRDNVPQTARLGWEAIVKVEHYHVSARKILEAT